MRNDRSHIDAGLKRDARSARGRETLLLAVRAHFTRITARDLNVIDGTIKHRSRMAVSTQREGELLPWGGRAC
jgi:hypothetical protein